MKREEFLTDLGRYLFDYSSIKKYTIPTEVLEDISRSYFIREEIPIYSHSLIDGFIVYVAQAPYCMVQYSRWRSSFMEHGYPVPILHFDEDSQKENT